MRWVTFGESVVGQAFGFVHVSDQARQQLDACRPKGKETVKVKVQFHVGLGGLRLAARAADNTGDASVARCIANRVKSQRPVWKADESGIIIVDARVPPKP